MNTAINEQRKRIRSMYTWMFRRYRTNTLADSAFSTISDKPVLGAELIPDASRWFNIDNDPYWAYVGNVTTGGGLLNYIATAGNTGIYRDFIPLKGKLVSITFSITSISSGGIKFINGLSNGATRTTIGTYTEQILIQDSRFYFWSVGTTTATIDNISVREVIINSVTTDYLKMAQNNRMDKSIRFGWLGEAGSKIESGKVSKAYSFDFNNYQNNATQTTAGSRPYLTGNIAPNEKLGLKNPNGGSNYMTHPTISFAANESWSVTIAFVFNGSNDYGTYGQIGIFNGLVSTLRSALAYAGGDNTLAFRNSLTSAATYWFVPRKVGKTVIISLVANGQGSLSLYFNGVLISTEPKDTTIDMGALMRGLDRYFTGSAYAHIIRSQALTPTQVTAEYDYLRSVYPEIESIVIGTQTWATSNCEMAATPQGNVIAEMQAAANVEKITNAADREFSSDTGWWTKGTGWSISGGTMNCNGSQSGIGSFYRNMNTPGKWYKITYTISAYTQGNFYVALESIAYKSPNRNAVGTYVDYIYQPTSGANVYFSNDATFIGSIDNVSVQEIGWSGSQELYDGIYAQTAGTVEQKTYAAVKAAGFWCHYNNSVDNGATYGKLYNWFAVKLLQMDIDYYNTANPTALWQWRVPTQADFQTLSTYLGGDAVSGGKLKLAGTTYWNSPNTGADNSSGFSALGGGIQHEDTLSPANLKNTYALHGIENYVEMLNTSGSLSIYGLVVKRRGASLRLIKAS